MKPHPLFVALALLSFAAPWGLAKGPEQPASADSSVQSDLAELLAPMLERHDGVVSIAFKRLSTGDSFAVEADREQPTASLIKFPIMVAVYDAVARGEASLDAPVTLREEDRSRGSGLLSTDFSPGVSLPLRDTVRLMIAWSDNTATNLVIDALGEAVAEEGEDPTRAGILRVNAVMDRLGLTTTRLHSKVFDRSVSVDSDRSERFGLGVTTAAETVALSERLVEGDPFGAGAGQPYGEADAEAVAAMCEEMLDHLRACRSTSTAPRLLPEGVVVAHKTGAVGDARCDGGVIEAPTGPIAFCVLTSENADQSWGPESPAELLIAEVSKAVYDYFDLGRGAVDAPRVARILRMGADDPMVYVLQRTLNARLDPSPKLAVDGDFGPNTIKAVKRFQRKAGLEPSGNVDGDTWKALGKLVTEDEPAPTPEKVNSAPPKPVQAFRLSGPPVTTCKAWAIADGKTGKLLFGHDDAKVRDPASVTKIMTAYLVCKAAEEDPAVLEQVVTFSRTADETTGSSARVRAGERVPVGELLYGLMLPSGNDASVAFAEHFGAKLPESMGETPYARFIQAMNDAAAELGMSQTGYRNPHGLTAKGHVTTAGDMIKLAHASMAMPTFRAVVKVRQRGATLDSVDGYQRDVVWNNTNRLLGFEGFYGVKTGTTGPAGACLVSAGERGGRPLLMVVLGATSSDGRYVDSRNLYRWAWKELGVE